MNARLAARLTGWKIDIQSDTEFAQAEADAAFGGGEEGAEDVSGRCAAILSNGKRCPNAALPGSKYCGVPAHQELALHDSDDEEPVVTESEPELEALADELAPDAESVGPSLPGLEVEAIEEPDSAPPIVEPAEVDPEEPEVSPAAGHAPPPEVPAGIPVESEEPSSED
jgi:N utilization substance protein A